MPYTTEERIEIENKILKRTIHDALASGCTLSVHDGDGITLGATTDADAVFNTMKATDEAQLILHKNNQYLGFIYFVYGNDGSDVISDYSTKLEWLMAPINHYSESFSA